MSPQRIQRQRVKGWRKPDNTVIIDRTSRWGNPFTTGDCLDAMLAETDGDARKVCVEAYDRWLDGDPEYASVEPERRARILADLHLLAGKNLACTCKPGEVCHGDPLIRRANRRTRQAVAS